MPRRRRYKAAPPGRRRRRVPPGEAPVPLTSAAQAQLRRQAELLDRLGKRASAAFADAEQRVDEELAQATRRAEQADAAAARSLEAARAKDQRRRDKAAARARRRDKADPATPPDGGAAPATADGTVDAAQESPDAAHDRALERARRGPRPRGLLARLRAGVAAWRRRRRHRAMLRRLDRALARRERRVGDLSSAALLDVLTERIARLSTTTASPDELADTIAVAQQLSDEYAGYLVRLAAARDASGATPALRDKATTELARCEAGRRRIDDAIAQLRALGKRTAPQR